MVTMSPFWRPWGVVVVTVMGLEFVEELMLKAAKSLAEMVTGLPPAEVLYSMMTLVISPVWVQAIAGTSPGAQTVLPLAAGKVIESKRPKILKSLRLVMSSTAAEVAGLSLTRTRTLTPVPILLGTFQVAPVMPLAGVLGLSVAAEKVSPVVTKLPSRS